MSLKYVTLKTAQRIAQVRGQAYLEDCLNFGELDSKTGRIFFTDEMFATLSAKWKEHDAAKGLGDFLHKYFGPIGAKIHWPCNQTDAEGKKISDLKPDSPCDKTRRILNRFKV